MRNYVQDGETIGLLAPYDVIAGAGMLVGSIFAVALAAASSGGAVEGRTRGVVDLLAETHATTQAIAQGGPVYWDNTNKRCTKTSSGNRLIGYATAAKASTAAVVRVLLTPSSNVAGAHIADIMLAAVTGVDGSGSNAASKADVDTRLTAIAAAFNALYLRLEEAGINLAA